MSDSTFALPYRTTLDMRVAPAARLIGQSLVWLGGGILFAATVFVMVALPGLID